MIQQLRPGDIGFVMNNSRWISKAISWFMGSKWSHTFLVLEATEERVYLSETSDYEVWIGLLSEYKDDPNFSYIIYSPKISDEERNKIVTACLKNQGLTYGYLQLLSLGLRRLLMRIGIKIPNFIRMGLVCCAHVLYGYRHTSIPGFSNIDPESIDTEETYQLVLNNLDRFDKVEEKV